MVLRASFVASQVLIYEISRVSKSPLKSVKKLMCACGRGDVVSIRIDYVLLTLTATSTIRQYKKIK